MTGIPDTGNRNRPTAAAPDSPTLEPNERVWLENYLERLKNAPAGLLKRLVVYGSKARGDAGPESDVDVLVLVGDAPNAVRNARKLLYGDDDPGGVDHNVVVQTEAGWLREPRAPTDRAGPCCFATVQVRCPVGDRPARSDAVDQPLRQKICRQCSRLFAICAACDRGHAYCTPQCRSAARRRAVRAARARHQGSPEGRLDHRDRQRAYRARRRDGSHFPRPPAIGQTPRP